MTQSINKVNSDMSSTSNKSLVGNNQTNPSSIELVTLSSSNSTPFSEFYVQNQGYMVGDGNSFNPNGDMTRAQMVQVLYAMEGKPNVGNANFSDVKADAWYNSAIAWAQSNGIVAGNTDGTFRPNDKITNEQMAAIMRKYAQYKGKDTSIKNSSSVAAIDKLDHSKYSGEALAWAKENNLFGVSEINNPKGIANRSTMATMLTAYDANYNPSTYNKVETQYKNGNTNIEKNIAINNINNISTRFSSFDEMFSEENYGASQNALYYDLWDYESFDEIKQDNSVQGQRAQIAVDLIHKYHPDATLEETKTILEAYKSVGCGYTSIADSFMLRVSSLPNGEKIFKDTMGYDMISKDSDGYEYNTDCVALEEFLYSYRNKTVNEIASTAKGKNIDDESFEDFYASKNIKLDVEAIAFEKNTKAAYDDMLEKVGQFTKSHTNATYTLTGFDYTVSDLDYTNTKDIDYFADSDIITENSKGLTRVSNHAQFLTGINEDNFIISTYSKKMAVPFEDSFNRVVYTDYKDKTKFYVTCVDFDLSKVGGNR